MFGLSFSLLCACPAPSEIPSIPVADCFEFMGQIQLFGVQRTLNGNVENSFTIATDDPALLATWTAAKALTTDEKVQFSPQIAEPVFEAGEMISYGTGNAVPGGIPINLGRNPSPFVGAFLNIAQSVITEIKKYECEPNLSVYLIDENKRIWGLVDDQTTPTIFKGIPIESFFVSDKVVGGREVADKNMINWSFKANWSDKLYAITPTDFNPITQLNS